MEEKGDFEKNNYTTTHGTEAPPYDGSERRASDAKAMRIDEAGELYGDLATVEQYGYVSRG